MSAFLGAKTRGFPVELKVSLLVIAVTYLYYQMKFNLKPFLCLRSVILTRDISFPSDLYFLSLADGVSDKSSTAFEQSKC